MHNGEVIRLDGAIPLAPEYRSFALNADSPIGSFDT